MYIYWRLKTGAEGDNREWNSCMASPTQWIWVWASSGRWWRIGKPGMHGVTKSWTQLINWTELIYRYICTPPSWAFLPPPVPPLKVITEHQVGLPVLYGSFPLASYFSHDSVYLAMLLSQFALPSSSATVSTTVFSRSASSPLHPCKQVHQCYFSRFHIYASIYDICKTLFF